MPGSVRRIMAFLAATALSIVAALWGTGPAGAQGVPPDDTVALALVRMARELRESPFAANAPVSYRAEANGHIYFYLDRDDGSQSIPMRVDQVAVGLYQSPTGQRRQIIRGQRKRELLPVRDFRYYIDRLTAVQNGFGDLITIGEGRDVRDAPHPLGSRGEESYHFRVTDSIRVSMAGRPEPLRVYEIEVRPRREELPGISGSIFLEAERGALVRMIFGFTPASYVDRRTDRITVHLEHRIWENRFWLPHRQVVEVRREMPELDLPVGTVIRANLEVVEYEFDPALEPDFFAGAPSGGLSVAPPPLRPHPAAGADSTLFRTGLMDRLAEEGLVPVPLAEIESEARRAARASLVSGLPRVRLYADRFSSVLRVNRAEGVHFGLGASFAPREATRLNALAGFATADRAPTGWVGLRWIASEVTTLGARIQHRDLRDAGPFAAAADMVNSISTLSGGRDYSDPWFETGARTWLDRTIGEAVSLRAGLAVVRMTRPGSPVAFAGADSGAWIRPAAEGVLARATGGMTRRGGGEGRWQHEVGVRGGLGRFESAWHGEVALHLAGTLSSADLSSALSLSLAAGLAGGTLPRQHHFLMGGRGTLPGHPFRAYGGRRFLLVRGEARRAIVPRWLSARLVAGVGAVGSTPTDLADAWNVRATDGLPGYAGVGLAALHELLRIDGVWGFPDGAFELVFSVDPWLRPFL